MLRELVDDLRLARGSTIERMISSADPFLNASSHLRSP
jgi:hypothetical protein